MNFWDQKYDMPVYKYGTLPNQFLQEQQVRLRPVSTVLLPGDGEGRNSVWLAQQGHSVTAVDSSALGLDKTGRLAAEKGVAVDAKLADLEHWAPEPGSFDAVVLTYVHLPASWRAQAMQRLARGLRGGGWFVLEAFHPLQLDYNSGGPKDASMLYTLQILREDLAAAGLQEALAWEGEVILAEGTGHQGPAYVTRYVAQRTAS
ncbi:MAG: class I SAM-dependent methyltransferase [Burkholderiaceae bacterium]